MDLSPEERERIRQNYKRFRDLSPERRQQLRDRFREMTPEQRERSDAYFEGGYWLELWLFLYGLAVALLLLATGLSARLRDLAR